MKCGVLTNDRHLIETSLKGEDKPRTIGAAKTTRIHYAISDMYEVDIFFFELLGVETHRGLAGFTVAIKSEQSLKYLITVDDLCVTLCLNFRRHLGRSGD